MRQSDPFSDLIRSIEENLQRGEDWVPPRDGETRGQQGNPRRWLWIVLPFLVLLLFNRFISFYADWVWYRSLELSSVFFTRIWAEFGLFVVATLAFWLFLAANVLIMRRIAPRGLADTPLEQFTDAFGVRVTPVILIVGAAFAFFMGLTASAGWERVLVFLNQTSFGYVDPVFGQDVGFFVFTLPIWQALRTWLLFTVIVTLAAVALVSGIAWRGRRVSTGVLAHLSILGALLLVLFAWQYRLDAYQLVYSTRGAIYGAAYADIHAQLPAYNILSIVTLLTAALLIVTVFLRRAWRAIVVVLVVWVAVAVLAGNVYPNLVQRFQVAPNELNLERPYIANNIDFTRKAFDLDTVEVQDYDASTRLTAEALIAERDTVRNIRLWDYRPLLQTYNQVQALRQYYEFNDIDIDRYVIDGQRRQVMLSARELVPERLSETAQTWVNRKLVYTHGFGVAASPVAQVTRDGLPEFYLKDLPPAGVIEITRPNIYFGERTDDYVIGRSKQPEFSYPRGDGNVTTSFDADTGIDMTFGARLLFALRFADINLLLNQDITAESQLLWRRNIAERVREVAPFLAFDQDPYVVVTSDGQLYWIVDAYTVSDRFPYSEPAAARINYIRNPVKVVVNAYDGRMTFYVVDEAEPILAAYRSIFPDLFAPFSAMPDDLKNNIRYPQDLFSIQAQVYRTYHMTDPDEFYNKEDLWAWPEEIFENTAQLMEPYYVLMQLPGSQDLDYIQILPFTPANRENMIAWLAAHSDPAKYGQKIVYEFGKDSLFFGPKQVEARIDQDPVISAQLSLWNQQGSNVIRGNLLVIPIGGSLLYVEPLYLQAAAGKIPELQRVIVATADQVVMAKNLGLALADLFGSELLVVADLMELAADVDVDELPPGQATTQPEVGTATVEQLIILANSYYERAQEHLRQGEWAGYGLEMEGLAATLEQLMLLTGAPPPEAPAPPEVPDTPAPEEAPATQAPAGS